VKKNELKDILKPLIKECIKEVIFEDGTLSGIISEVAKGLNGVSTHTPTTQPLAKSQNKVNHLQESTGIRAARDQLSEVKKSLSNATGLEGIFEGTKPMYSGGARGGSKESQHGALRGMDPHDPGVDISGIMKIAGGAWGPVK